jgi:predicted RNase H-like HicB family nuclease
MYRVGLPGWKFAARMGMPVRLRVNIRQDLEANVYVAESPDLSGLIVEGHTLDDIKSEALAAAGILLEMELQSRPDRKPISAQTDFILHSPVPA